jgi:hypothetical protein
LRPYVDIQSELIYDQHINLFEDDRDIHLIAARVLGREIKGILKQSSDVEKRIIDVLQKEISDAERSKIAELMVSGTENTIESVTDILREILKGIEEEYRRDIIR